jgi:3-oxoacyl-[acyl-carrier-protein] synthase-3
MQSRKIKILGLGKYLPKRIVTSKEIDIKLGVRDGWTENKSGVNTRHYIEKETASEMGALAIIQALKDAKLSIKDIDCLICASGTMEQAIPCTATLISEKFGDDLFGIPAFDFNSTCLSFVTALDHISYAIDAGRYNKVIIVSSEISSVGLNWDQRESCALFGDGAVAVIIGKSNENEDSRIISSRMETYSKGAHLSEIRGGGTKIHSREYKEETKDDFLFDMDGRAIFRLSSKLIEDFVEKLLPNNMDISDMKIVVPHQASAMAMRIIRGKLGIPEEKFISIIYNHGNVIAASIPLALNEAIKQNKLNRGDKFMLIGTSAGLSIGGIVLEY